MHNPISSLLSRSGALFWVLSATGLYQTPHTAAYTCLVSSDVALADLWIINLCTQSTLTPLL